MVCKYVECVCVMCMVGGGGVCTGYGLGGGCGGGGCVWWVGWCG